MKKDERAYIEVYEAVGSAQITCEKCGKKLTKKAYEYTFRGSKTMMCLSCVCTIAPGYLANYLVNDDLEDSREVEIEHLRAEISRIVSERDNLSAQLADMARRKDGWRRLTRGLYRYALSESVGGDVEGTEDYWNSLYGMQDEIRRHLDNIENGVRMWGRGTYDGTVQK